MEVVDFHSKKLKETVFVLDVISELSKTDPKIFLKLIYAGIRNGQI